VSADLRHAGTLLGVFSDTRLVTRGILTEPEPGLFAQPCP
jgi:hypothetical protein